MFAGLSDIYDGKLARSQSTVSTFGKFVDPVADKLLLAATLIPFYMLSEVNEVCRWVPLPVLLIVLGREALVTVLRYYSMWKGVIFGASRLAKFKTAFQMFFIGSILINLCHQRMLLELPQFAYPWFTPFHDKINGLLMVIVLALTLISAVQYLRQNLSLLGKQSIEKPFGK